MRVTVQEKLQSVSGEKDGAGTPAEVNEVHLSGRVSGGIERRELPSGDGLVTFRLVVARSRRRGAPAGRAPGVDTIDIACWSASTRAVAARLEPGSGVAVDGSLRRRFFATSAGRASRYEVEAGRLRRVGPATQPDRPG